VKTIFSTILFLFIATVCLAADSRVYGNLTVDGGIYGDGSNLTGLPDPDLSLYVPYTGASSQVNLGSQNFLTTGTLGAGAGTLTSLNTHTIPAGTGTIALTSDIPGSLLGLNNNWTGVNTFSDDVVFNTMTTPATIDTGGGTSVCQIYTWGNGSSATLTEINQAPADWIADADGELSTSEYAKVSVSDTVFSRIFDEFPENAGNDYCGYLIAFKFNPSISGFTYLKPHAEVIADDSNASQRAGLYIYNFTTSTWGLLASTTSEQSVWDSETVETISAEITTNLSNYFDANNTVWIMVRMKDAINFDGVMDLDYVKLDWLAKNVLTDGKWYGDFQVVGNLSVAGAFTPRNLIPASDSAYVLGSWTNSWKSLFIDNVNVKNSIVITDDQADSDSSVHFKINKALSSNAGSLAWDYEVSYDDNDELSIQPMRWTFIATAFDQLDPRTLTFDTHTLSVRYPYFATSHANLSRYDVCEYKNYFADGTYGGSQVGDASVGLVGHSALSRVLIELPEEGGSGATFNNNWSLVSYWARGSFSNSGATLSGSTTYSGLVSENGIDLFQDKGIYFESYFDGYRLTRGDTYIKHNTATTDLDVFVDNTQVMNFDNDVVTSVVPFSWASNPAFPKIYSQATEPDIPNNTTAFWKDTDDSKYYLILDIAGTQKKLELT